MDLKTYLDRCYYFVEADSFAVYSLWYMYVHSPHPKSGPIEFEQISTRFIEKVGENTHVEFIFAKIYGKLVCFYSTSSMKVDWQDITAFLSPYIAKTGKCNATNFHQCIHVCQNF